MDSAHDHSRPRGLPNWTLWSAIPVVLALGFVVGMAIATYNPTGSTENTTPTGVQAPTAQSNVQPAPTAAPTEIDTSFLIPTSTRAPGGAVANPTAGTRPSTPAFPPVKFTGPVNTMDDARKALASDFGTFARNGITFTVEYQAYPQAAASGTSLVGMISTGDYPAWERALREQPDALTAWLKNAAERVREATARAGFYLSWAVIDVVQSRPAGYADKELTLMENDSYLVVRRLAATMDYSKTEISLRPAASLQDSAANKQITSTDAWATYGPLIRFDGDDIYRPAKLTGLRPKK
ncbi:MAG TPA: hypothetical protein VNT75_27155 [Symbiobacteriaceae bacterium]|nr:hypothetical protein [Symbiobacteriaceae bacterium]